MKIKYRHTNIIAKDWESLCDFYRKVFGCVDAPPKRKQSGDWLAKGTNTPGAALEGMHLFLPGLKGMIIARLWKIFSYQQMKDKHPAASNRQGFGHIAFEVEDVSVLLQKALQHGGKKFGEVITREIPGVGVLNFTYILDPEDNIIELQSWS